MKNRDPKRIEAAIYQFQRTQKRMAFVTVILIMISCISGLILGEMWLPLDLAENLSAGTTRLISATILGIAVIGGLKGWQQSRAAKKRRKAIIASEFGGVD